MEMGTIISCKLKGIYMIFENNKIVANFIWSRAKSRVTLNNVSLPGMLIFKSIVWNHHR